MINTFFKKCVAFIILFLFLSVSCFSISGQTINQKNVITNDRNHNIPQENHLRTNLKQINDDPPNLLWNKTFGGESSEMGTFVQQTSDGGYINTANIYGTSHYDGLLIKTDSEGNELWNRTYGGPYEDIFNCVRETNDNGYIIVGYSKNSQSNLFETWLIKTDENGYLQWEKRFLSNPPEGFGEYVLILDDGYLLMATVYIKSGGNDIWLIKTDFNGNEIWNKTIGNNLEDDFSIGSVIKTSNNEFVIVGGTREYFPNKILLIKTDYYGNRLWRKTYDGKEGFNVFETEDEGYMITGGLAEDAYLIKTDKDGNELWRKSFSIRYDYWCWASTQTSDGGYIIAGGMGLYDNGFIMKFDAEGNKFWEFYLGGDKRDSISCAIESDDGNYVFCGETASYSAGKYDVWLIKMSPFENTRPSIPNKPNGPNHGRPYTIYTFTTSSNDSDGEILYYTWDWGNNHQYIREGPFNNNEPCIIEYGNWQYWDDFDIRVKAIDEEGGESNWSEPLRISISRLTYKHKSLFIKFLLLLF
jgi:hypothetical protein